MRALALIPARGGSERVKRKNMRTVGGLTLVHRAVIAAQEAGLEAWVSSEDEVIQQHAASVGALVRTRPIAHARPTSSLEDVVRDWLWHLPGKERPDYVVVLQPTSPLRTGQHVWEALDLLVRTKACSVVSVQVDPHCHFAGRLYPREDAFDWRPFRPWDYRPRTQDVQPWGRENGAIYAFTKQHWKRHERRDGGDRCIAYPMDETSSVDVDTEDDLRRAEALLGMRRAA